MKVRSVAFLLLSAAALIVVRISEGTERHTFGYADALDIAVLVVLWLLGMTHMALAGIMLAQRAPWVPTEAAMFRFVGAKALFWFNLATAFVASGLGIRLDITVLYLVVAGTTIDLDVRLVRRYIFGKEDALLFPTPPPATASDGDAEWQAIEDIRQERERLREERGDGP